MIDMKQKPESPVALIGAESEDGQYPEGLRFEVSGDQLRSLGFGEGTLPHVGNTFNMSAKVEVVEVCKEDGVIEKGYCVEFQIQMMDLAKPDDMNEQQRAFAKISSMYGNG